MANFNEAFELLINHEGGYVNDPRDKGGETKFGISKASYPHLNIPELTIEDAKILYFDDWWRPLRLRELQDQDIANLILSCSVNMGPKRCVVRLQRAVRSVKNTILEDDGILGSKTISAINTLTSNKIISYGLLCAFKSEMANLYRETSDDWCLNGVLNRIYGYVSRGAFL